MLAFEQKVPIAYRKPFIAKVIEISNRLKINPNWLMAVMDIETGGTFDPSITNKQGYTGLIQFGSGAAKDLGTTTTALRKMSAVNQLYYVEAYYKMWFKRLGITKPNSYTDTYLIVLFPEAVNKGENFIIKSDTISANKFAINNPIFDKDGNQIVKVGDVKAVMLKKLPSEWLNDGDVKTFIKAYKPQLAIGISLAVIGISSFFYFKSKK